MGRPPSKHNNMRVKVQNDVCMSTNIPDSQIVTCQLVVACAQMASEPIVLINQQLDLKLKPD